MFCICWPTIKDGPCHYESYERVSCGWVDYGYYTSVLKHAANAAGKTRWELKVQGPRVSLQCSLRVTGPWACDAGSTANVYICDVASEDCRPEPMPKLPKVAKKENHKQRIIVEEGGSSITVTASLC